MRVALLLVYVWLLTGCQYIISEPYPAFTFEIVAPEKLPRHVKDAFTVVHPNSHIERVETESFKGQVGQYRIWFQSEQGQSDYVIFDRDGSPVVMPGVFKPAAKAPNGALEPAPR